jgi:ABC-type nitrate/sulfonate/bicarbonate transport system permease component
VNGALLRATGRGLAQGALSLLVVVVLWEATLRLLDVSPFIGKGPLDVWGHLVTDDGAAENRAVATALVGRTLADAAIGFVAGLAAASVLALMFTLFTAVEQALMPLAMLLRTVPLIAMAPIIVLIFGRDAATVAVMGGIVVLFPALVNMVFGLRSASPPMLDVVAVYGGGRLAALRKVALPASLPSFLAAVKISVPGAVTGAVIAEWLATGEGVGHGIVFAIGQAQMAQVWSLVVLVTLATVLLYGLVSLLERLVLTGAGLPGSPGV